MKNEERWLPVCGYEGLYEVSDMGRIRSLDRKVFTKSGKFLRFQKGKIRKPHKSGYERLLLSNGDGTVRINYVHRLVAIAFIPNPDNKPQVNHINGVKDDNRVENLEWVTSSENNSHAFRTGLNNGSWNGKKFSDEHRRNISKGKKGSTPWNKGKKSPITHGILSGYLRGCRCEKCTKANTDKCRRVREKKKAKE